jgi:tetratricopeptide (TPR) repeat protein
MKLQPSDAASFRARAEILRQLGDLAGAEADLAQARLIEPGNSEIALRQAALYEDQGRIEEALQIYAGVIPTLAEPGPVYLRAGKLRYDLGQYSRALANYQTALATMPESPEAHYGVGLSQRKLGSYRAAIVSFREYLRRAPEAPERAELEGWMAKHGA